MSDLKEQITSAMKTAMREKDKPRLGVIRLMLAAIKQIEIDERKELDDTETLAVLDKMLKQRRESIKQYEAAARQDLLEQEQYEVGVIQDFMPAQLDEAEIDSIIDAAIAETGASSMKEMGKVMGIIRPRLQGRADMGAVSGKIKARLG
ncbi:GatB/YqeY domain-containing protein [Sulfuriflexus sp.]|uniref:GatB/YqeY domain-containing protein n=1 Tax=Sulfuriflexus sp. TaxID=2015443 RepID=UPI0028CFA9A2|nr:GatB/YqeY domain-containing protein [Sulfuriflexus sp.]MDT8405042.1 GatB/YqeY domain-containing protein [Sulfuriflexus sp.]